MASDARDESHAQRDDRNLAELLQELRVAGLGVQVLFGFMLSLPFTNRFTRLSHGQRELISAAVFVMFGGLWFVFPLAHRGEGGPAAPGADGTETIRP
jgi:Family of unknown function (DUF6328)